MNDYGVLRERMVRDLVAARGVHDQRVLEAMRKVPRHLFVRDHLRSQAYGDHALPIGAAQTISQPYVVARMTELLELSPQHSVLEIGTGSGYQTALLALLARRVYSLERIALLAQQAIPRMRQLGLENVKIQVFDGTVGWSEWAPYNRILVSAGAPRVPEPLLDQLAPGGSLLIPEGALQTQRLVLYRKSARGELRRKEGEEVAFVPQLAAMAGKTAGNERRVERRRGAGGLAAAAARARAGGGIPLLHAQRGARARPGRPGAQPAGRPRRDRGRRRGGEGGAVQGVDAAGTAGSGRRWRARGVAACRPGVGEVRDRPLLGAPVESRRQGRGNETWTT
jgi:protein-L-isoaspartate(D-aspartate) O-methyltransferase